MNSAVELPAHWVAPTSLSGDWTGIVVYCAANPWDGNRFPDQHIAERLARFAPVLYVDPPLSVLAPWRAPAVADSLHEPKLRVLKPGLARLTPIGPPAANRRGVQLLTHVVRRRAIRQALKDLNNPTVHAVVAGSFAPVFGLCDERRRVFFSTDDFVAGAKLMSMSASALARHEARQLRSVDTVVVCSPGLLERYRRMGLDPVLVPNGCDDELFASTDDVALPPDVDLPAPVAGFVGHLTDRIDLPLLEAVADRGCSLLLVGGASFAVDMARFQPLLDRPNVQWVGAKPFSELPSYLRAIDVGLLPYGDTEFNRGSFPLKVLEYLAAGRGAVSTGLPAVRWIDTELIDVADEPASFADAVERALPVPRTPDLVAARKSLARQHSWSRRAEEMAAAIGLPMPVAG